MEDPAPAGQAPEPVDPATAPRILLRVASTALLVGVLMFLLGARSAASSGREPAVSAGTFVTLFVVSWAAGGLLLSAHFAIGWWRLRRYERRFGFLPRAGRKELPSSGRTTLVRLEYGSRGDRVCLMLNRWDHTYAGWQRGRALEVVWVESDDAVALGEQRARLTTKGERLEEDFDDARLAGDGDRELADELSAERAAAGDESHRLAETLARDEVR